MKNKILILAEKLGENRILRNEPLSKYVSLRIGGPADIFYKAGNTNVLIQAVTWAQKLSIPYFILGGGTNLLVSDKGFGGLVIKNETNNIRLLAIKGKKTSDNKKEDSIQKVYLSADSGVSINRLVRFTLDAGMAGLEYFLGQPGTVGGAMYINAHNIKKSVFWGDKILQAKILNKDGKIEEVKGDYFKFGYDQSIIQKTKDLVLSVVLELERADKKKLWEEASETLEYRRFSQPTGAFSAGCIFRNIPKSDAIRIATPNFTTSAGYLIESVGLKGTKIGEASFSDNHANFIIHRGEAKAGDVLKLILLAKKKVKDRYNIDLVEEIVTAGEFN